MPCPKLSTEAQKVIIVPVTDYIQPFYVLAIFLSTDTFPALFAGFVLKYVNCTLHHTFTHNIADNSIHTSCIS